MMTWPEHKNPKKHREAHAPYNYVPLPDEVRYLSDTPDPTQSELPPQDRYHPEDRYTGYLEATLRTETPLYVRCGLTPVEARAEVEAKNRPDFFYTDPDTLEPVIPGSSLRGMLRTLVEIVSYGKVQPVTDRQKITFRAVAGQQPLTRPYQAALGKYGRDVKVGYVERQGERWAVRPAQRPQDRDFKESGWYLKVKDALIDAEGIPDFTRFTQKGYRPQYHDVAFEAEDRRGKRGPYTLVTHITAATAESSQQGVLVCTGNMAESGEDEKSPRKNYALVLPVNERARPIPIAEQAVQDYVDTLTDFEKTSPPFDAKWGCLIEGRPIFFVERNGEIVAFGHCPNFRIPAWLADTKPARAATPRDFVPDALRDATKTDLAEAVFGYVASDTEQTLERIKTSRPVARRGRVCVTQATLTPADQGAVWFDPEQPVIRPKILSSPKPTAFQLYLAQPEPNTQETLRHYGSPTPDETVIRGHKLYWHKPDLQREDWVEQEPVSDTDSQHTQIKPLRAGLTFAFKLYFEDLDPVELGALLWVFDIAADEDHRLKLGMGKPLGLGSVAILADLHLTDREDRYGALFDGMRWALGEAEDPEAIGQAWETAVRAFREWILSNAQVAHKDDAAFEDLPRVRMLRALLRWPGPDKARTRYMSLQDDDRAYRDRHVLPDPAGVLDEVLVESEQRPSTAPQPVEERPRGPASLEDVVHPESVADVQIDDVLIGTVTGVDSYRVELDLGLDAVGTMGLERLDSLVSKHPFFRRMYPDLSRATAAEIYENGELEEDLYHTEMLVRVRDFEEVPGKILIKLDFEQWLD